MQLNINIHTVDDPYKIFILPLLSRPKQKYTNHTHTSPSQYHTTIKRGETHTITQLIHKHNQPRIARSNHNPLQSKIFQHNHPQQRSGNHTYQPKL